MLTLPPQIRVGIFTLRDVAPGEELTYDYQFQHFGLVGASFVGSTCARGLGLWPALVQGTKG